MGGMGSKPGQEGGPTGPGPQVALLGFMGHSLQAEVVKKRDNEGRNRQL